MAGHNIIVLDTYDDCIELLEKRSATYSGRFNMFYDVITDLSRLICIVFCRMTMTMVNELMGWGFNFAAMDYGALRHIFRGPGNGVNCWRHSRKHMA